MRIKDMVEEVLATNPKARDSDQYLTLCVWRRYYHNFIENVDGRMMMPLESFLQVPREDTIKRIRADIQNRQGRYLPSLNIAIARKIKANFIKATYPEFTGSL